MPLDWPELEELGFEAFPAVVQERIGPLVCRASGGFNYRNSSVTLTRATDDWPQVLDQSIAFCRAHDIETVLRVPDPIAPGTPPQGWERFREARVMLRDVGASDTSGAGDVRQASWDEWIDFQHAHRGEDPEKAKKFETVMRSLEGRNMPVIHLKNGRIAGAALIAPSAQADGLMNMLVDPAFRGKGIGGRFLDALLAASDSENKPMWLQVLKGNAPAERLYRSRGFKLAYDYGYYRPAAG